MMCERAEMSERGIYARTKAVFEYFSLPFRRIHLKIEIMYGRQLVQKIPIFHEIR
jgi:hypothetical protein